VSDLLPTPLSPGPASEWPGDRAGLRPGRDRPGTPAPQRSLSWPSGTSETPC